MLLEIMTDIQNLPKRILYLDQSQAKHQETEQSSLGTGQRVLHADKGIPPVL